MSAFFYCPSCGSQNSSINGSKPNFCVSCGYNLQSLAVFGAPNHTNQAKQAGRALDVSLEEGSSEEASIDMRDVEIVNNKSSKIKLKSLLGTAAPGEEGPRQPINTKLAARDASAAYADYKKEAGTLASNTAPTPID
jgi:hypothetical protein